MSRISRLLLLTGWLALFAMPSCKKESVRKEEDTPAGPIPEITVIFTPDGLGDMSYNDQILRGIELFINEPEPDFYINFITPYDLEDAEFLVSNWWKDKDVSYEEDGSISRRLLVLASSEYAELARSIVDPTQIDMDFSILAFEAEDIEDETDNIRTFEFSLYGTSWLAGRTALELGCKFPMILLGNAANLTTYDGREGFIDGYQKKSVAFDALSDDWQGYGMAMEAYQRMHNWDGVFDFIYSISGGSNMGIYRYLRENPECGIYTAGMDVDQSAYSTLIVGSMVKRIDLVLYDYLTKWYYGEEVPRHQKFGLESGYMDWVIPDRYANLRPIINPLREEAIKQEKEYEESDN